MSDFFRFREFPVYSDARKLRKELKNLSRKKFPKEEHNNYLSKAENLARQLKAFSSKVRKDNKRNRGN